MYTLYYLNDQNGPLDGDKSLQGQFPDLVSAQEAAVVLHFSVETSFSGIITVVFIC
jgi:hypothetical protein